VSPFTLLILHFLSGCPHEGWHPLRFQVEGGFGVTWGFM